MYKSFETFLISECCVQYNECLSVQCDRDDSTVVDTKLIQADAKGLHEVWF